MMKLITQVIASVALVLAVPVARAIEEPFTIETDAFTLSRSRFGYGPDVLVSNEGGVAKIGLTDMARMMVSITTPGFPYYSNGSSAFFQIDMHPGYRFTGFSMSGTFVGTNYVGQLPAGQSGQVGYAQNAIGIGGAAVMPDGTYLTQPFHLEVADLNGVDEFVLHSAPIDVATTFYIFVSGYFSTYASSATWEDADGSSHYDPSRVKVALPNPVLTIYAQAVPEPQTYVMLLAGLTLIGALRRRALAS